MKEYLISFLGAWAPVLLMMGGMGGFLLGLHLTNKQLMKGKRSPFPGAFLRGPGHSLYERIEDLHTEFIGWMVVSIVLPPALLAIPLSQAYFTGKSISTPFWILMALVGLTGFVLTTRRGMGLLKEVRRLRLGHEGEVGVGQELNQLMLHGCHVYHDFPADGFNIDHIVVGPTGVFAVETKARSKRNTGNTRREATMTFDGLRLVFPTHSETAPLKQAQRQARWLSQWLANAVGEKVPVKAALVIPGWFVDRKKNSDVLVFNDKEAKKAIINYRGERLTEAMIRRVVHQVERECRDVVPTAIRSARETKK